MDNTELTINIPLSTFIRLILGYREYKTLGKEDKWLWDKLKELDPDEKFAHYDILLPEKISLGFAGKIEDFTERKETLYTIWNLQDWRNSQLKNERIQNWSKECHERRCRKEDELARIAKAMKEKLGIDQDFANSMASIWYHKKNEVALKQMFGIEGVEFDL